MKIIQAICVKNECYLSNKGKKRMPTGIVVHSTGANNTKLSRYCDNEKELGKNPNGNHWNQARPDGRQVCVHGFIGHDKNGSVEFCQTLPFDISCWGCGKGTKGSYNTTHIQFEICEDGLVSKEYFEKAYNKAIELCAYLCKQYNISPKKIVCHKEAWRQGYGSNHGDVEHWFPKFGKTMDDFRKAVEDGLDGETQTPEKPKTSTTTAKKGSFAVKVKADGVNIRKGPSTSHEIVGIIKDHGIYTIAETSEDGKWGKLKSGIGWIIIDQIYVDII